jgi:hypothetical protein
MISFKDNWIFGFNCLFKMISELFPFSINMINIKYTQPISLNGLKDRNCTGSRHNYHSYIPNYLRILHIYFTTCLWQSLYIIFTHSVQTNWKGLQGRLVDRQTNNLNYWKSTPSRRGDLPLPSTNSSIYHRNIKINKIPFLSLF